ncbi:MAG TPA: M14 metallopeptidase family protein [Candidatus Xenobia bacterium]|nr:M14 metallopeptidase family protein [Candidatus Xenobia bacterium]
MRRLSSAWLFFLLPLILALPSQAALPTPEEFAGFRMGEEGKLVRWEKIVEYFNLAAQESDRVIVQELGKSTLKNPFIMAIISSPANLARLEEIKATQRRLAYPYALSPEETERLARSSPAVLLITLNIHSTEIGSTQMSLELIHRLATEKSPWMDHVLNSVVFLLVPSFNPDGQIMVVDWYEKTKDGGALAPMPWLYHHYTGHDNNRDAFMLTQVESRLVTKVLYQDWFPQAYLDEHQMGNQGPRIFVPPFRNPINPNVDPIIWAENGLLGFAMFTALHEAGLDGITYDQFYTSWWQGGFLMEAWWHNIVGLLTEVASTRMATSVEQEKARLGVPPKDPPMSGDEFQDLLEKDPKRPLPAPRDVMPRNNYPKPWLGGKWTLRDIIDYELVATYALLEAMADNRVTLIENQARMGRNAIEAGKKGNPYAWVFPPHQHDGGALYRLLEILRFAGVEVHRAEKAFKAGDTEYPAGSYVILMAQPFRAYAKDMLEIQKHPDPKTMPAGAMADQPYDVTAWTLPLQMGVEAKQIDKPFEAELTKLDSIPRDKGTVRNATRNGRTFVVAPGPNSKVILTNRLLKAGAEVSWLTEKVSLRNSWTFPAGSLFVRNLAADKVAAMVEEAGVLAEEVKANDAAANAARRVRLRAPRVGLYQPWTASMDEGWTRWLLEQFEFPYTTLHNADIKAGKLGEKFDVIVFPADRNKQQILEGNKRKWMPEQYRGGIGEDGLKALQEFVRGGGTLVLLDDSTQLALESWAVPVKNALKDVKREDFSCPGSLLRILVDPSHPVAYGMPPEATAFYDNGPAFDLAPGFSYTDVKVIARYPAPNPLQSGWIRGPEHLANRIAAAEVTYEKGRIILIGFGAQFRAQPHNTFKLFFNSLHYAAAEKP